jgi:hypothetical protein
MRKIGLGFAVIAAALCTAGGLVSRSEGPRQMALVGHARLSAIYTVKACLPYAYALEAGLLYVLDVSKPSNVRVVSEMPFKLARRDIAIYRDWLFLSGFASPLALADISQPDKPRWVAEFPELGGTLSHGMEIRGDTLFAVNMPDWKNSWQSLIAGVPAALQVVDIHDSRHPVCLASIDLGVVLHMPEGVVIAVTEDHLHVLVRNAREDDNRSELIRVNVADAKQPFIERRDLLPQGKKYKAMGVLGDTLFLLAMAPQHGLALFQLHEGAAPTPIGEITDPSLWWGIEIIINQNYVYATFKGKDANLATFDVSNPAQPQLVDKYSIEGFGAAGLGMDMVGGRLYVAGDWAPMPIFDVSLGVPRLLGKWDYQGGWADELAVSGTELYVANWGDGLVAYDVRRPSAPKLRWRYNPVKTSDTEQDLILPRVWGKDLLLGFSSRPAELLEAGGREPKLIASYQPAGEVSALAVCGEYAYFGLSEARGEFEKEGKPQEGGIEVVRRQGTVLRSIARVRVPAGVADLASAEGRVVSVTNGGDVLLFDAREPASLRLTGKVALGKADNTARLALAGDCAYVLVEGDKAADLYVIDLEDEDMRIIRQHHFDAGGGSAVLAASERYLVLHAGQLKVLDISIPAEPVLVAEQPLESFGEPEALAIDAGNLYVSDAEAGVWIYALPASRSKSSSKEGDTKKLNPGVNPGVKSQHSTIRP